MADRTRRKELSAQYKEAPPPAGVYRIVNTRTNQVFIGVSPNLDSMRGKLEFARATGGISVLDRRLHAAIREHGLDAFTLDVLDTLDVKPEMTTADIRKELAVLEELWREQQDPALLY
jgi:hypothetical protein